MTQTRKILLQLVALVVIAGGLGGYAWFGVVKKDEHTKKKQDHELRLFAPQKLDERQADGGSPPAEFTTLSVGTKEGTTLLERRGKDWWITSPVKVKADHFVIDGITSQLQSAKFKDTLEEDPDAATLAKYGLDAPEFVVEATARVNGEQRTVKLIGGKENTFDGSVYVRRNAEKPVFTAEGGVRFMLQKSTFDLRDKIPFAVEENKVQQLVLKSKINEYTVAREPGGKLWSLRAPTIEPADAPTITTMLTGVLQDRAQAFPEDTPAMRSQLGFDAPMLSATLTLEDGKVVKLAVNRLVSDGGELFYGLRQDDDGAVLAQLGPNALQFDRNPNDLRDRAVVRFKREAVTKIIFHDPAQPEVIVQRDGVDASAEGWRLVSPREGKAKVFKITGALWMLGSMKASAAGEEKPKDWGRYGLDAKGKWIALFGEDGKELARLTIGKEIIGKSGSYYVRGTREQVFESDGSRFGEFPFSVSTLLDEPDAGSASDAGP
jgi:hypothetical protein